MYTTTAKMIVNIIAIFWFIILFSNLYVSNDKIAIIKVAKIGFRTNFVNSNFIFTFFFKAYILIIIDIIWQSNVPTAAPTIPPSIKSLGFIFINITLVINFTITPIPSAITGI